jgi:hypothetical protein
MVDTNSSLTEQMNRINNALKAASGYQLPNMATLAGIRTPSPSLESLKIPTPKERNEYQSAAVLMKELANTIITWRAELPADAQPVVIAILNGGIQIHVSSLAQVSFHGIRVEGTIEHAPCMMLAHQSAIQLLCYTEAINSENPPRKKIGFIIDGEHSEA